VSIGMSVITILCHLVIQLLNSDVVAEQVKALSVGLPEKLEPWRQNGTICTILHVFTTHSTHQQAAKRTQ